MRIKFITYSGLEALKKNIKADSRLYGNNEPKELLQSLNNTNFVDIGAECKPFNLIISNDPKDDLENMKRVYTSLKDTISPSMAADERLWVGLALHDKCWPYVNARWKKGGWTTSTIKDRFFFGQHPRTRNAIMRLFWVPKLTYDESNPENPWHYTEFVCSNQRFIEDILGRNTSNNIMLLKACVDACDKYSKDHGDKPIDSITMRAVQRYMSILGGTYVIDTINYDSLKNKIYKELESLIAPNGTPLNNSMQKQ